jgi:hypothetical protein
MASLLESLSQTMASGALGQLGKAVGLDTNQVGKGMEVVGPLITGALAQQSSSATGLDGLMKLLPQAPADEAPASLLGNLISAFTSGGGASNALTSGLFGGGLSAIAGTLDKTLGFKASSLLTIVAPMVLGLVGRAANERKLDKNGLATLLQEEQAAFQRSGSPAVQLVQTALDAGAQANALKSKYPDNVWTKVRVAPVAAAELVITSSPSGALGALKEISALGDAMAATRQAAAPTSLLGMAFEAEPSDEEVKSVSHDPPALLALIREAVGAVAARNPTDAAAYGSFLVDVATRVAESSKEGGFLGFGGTRVSEAEAAMIEQIKSSVTLARAAGA